MNLTNIIERATDFGSRRSQKNFFSFTLKILFYIIPAVIIGNYTDNSIKNLKTYKILGDNDLYYFALQSLLIITTLYVFAVFFEKMMREIHNTISGVYFIVLYFGIQTNYIYMIKNYLTTSTFKKS